MIQLIRVRRVSKPWFRIFEEGLAKGEAPEGQRRETNCTTVDRRKLEHKNLTIPHCHIAQM
jgi:hypothetical protein